MGTKWYAEFFDGVVVDMWRRAVPAERTLAEVDFLERTLRLDRGGRVLDVPCGHGRHAVELALRGYEVTGVDLSTEMLAHAHAAAAEAGVEVDWRQADMRDLSGKRPWSAAYCCGNSFGYLGPEGDREFLAAVARRLAAGGSFVLHTGMVAECVLPGLAERSWAPMGEMLFLEENRYDAAASCLETTYTFVLEGRRESRTARHQVYTTRELVDLMAGAGLVATGLFGSVEGDPFELDSPELFVVARRPEKG